MGNQKWTIQRNQQHRVHKTKKKNPKQKHNTICVGHHYINHYYMNDPLIYAPGFVNYKKGALDSQPQVIKFTSYLPMVGGSLRILRLLPPLKLVAMI